MCLSIVCSCYSERRPQRSYLERLVCMRYYIKHDSHMVRQCAAVLAVCVRNAVMD